MEDKESLKVLSEIRDEMKEMNAQIKWLKSKATEAMDNEENSEYSPLKVAELENKKSKKDLQAILVLAAGFGVWFLLEKLGYLSNI
jgi:hypothetical protein